MTEFRDVSDPDIAEYTDEIVCPWCGYVHSTSYEFFSNSREDANSWCGHCDKPIAVTKHVSVYYSAKKIE